MNPHDDMPIYSLAAVTALRAELAEARALYVGAQEDLNEAVGSVVALRAELSDMSNALTNTCEDLANARHEANVAEAAIARVRELCDASDQGYDWTCFVSDVRAALEGR